MKWLCLLALTFALYSESPAATDSENEKVVVLRIDKTRGTLAASDTTSFGEIRAMVNALKSQLELDVQITTQKPATVRPTGQYLKLTWTEDGNLEIKATGKTKHGIISVLSSKLAAKPGDRVLITLLPEKTGTPDDEENPQEDSNSNKSPNSSR